MIQVDVPTTLTMSFSWPPAQPWMPQPLVSHGAHAALGLGRIGDAAQRSRHHVAMFESAGEARPLIGVVAQPMQKLRETPFRGINAAAPLDGLQLFLVG